MSETAQMCLEGIFLSQKQVVAPLVATKSEEEFQIKQRQKRAFGLLAMRSLYKSKTVDLVPEAEQYGGTNILYNLQRVHGEKVNVRNGIKILDIPEIGSMLAMANLGDEYFSQIQTMIFEIQNSPDDILNILEAKLRELTDAKAVKIFTPDTGGQHLIDLTSNSHHETRGLVQNCLTSQQIDIYQNPRTHEDYNPSTDSLGISDLESLVVIPVLYSTHETKGVIAIANGTFDEKFKHMAKFLSMFLKSIFHEVTETGQDKGRRLKSILHWCRQVFLVTIHSMHKYQDTKEIMSNAQIANSFEKMVSLALDQICIVSNSEDARIYYLNGEETKIFCRSNICAPDAELSEHVLQVIKTKSKLNLGHTDKFENMLLMPILTHGKLHGVLQVSNKKGDANRVYREYVSDNENMIQIMVDGLSEEFNAYASEQKIDIEALRQLIRQHGSQLSQMPIQTIIRQASKNLLNCDRSTIFTRRGDFMTVQPQGMEAEIPTGLSVPIGKGIIGDVA